MKGGGGLIHLGLYGCQEPREGSMAATPLECDILATTEEGPCHEAVGDRAAEGRARPREHRPKNGSGPFRSNPRSRLRSRRSRDTPARCHSNSYSARSNETPGFHA